ncbi:MAG: PilZ domain-containing protein [Lentisphaerae bacterium]|nr:PilZ domain-containing protein [Lentisphaerota bacterium]
MKFSAHSQANDNRRAQRRIKLITNVDLAQLRGPFRFLVRRPQFQGELQDASIGGVQLLLDRSLPVRLDIRLWIQVSKQGVTTPLMLDGIVRWSLPAKRPGTFMVGIQLHTKPHQAMQSWAETMIEEMRFAE